MSGVRACIYVRMLVWLYARMYVYDSLVSCAHMYMHTHTTPAYWLLQDRPLSPPPLLSLSFL